MQPDKRYSRKSTEFLFVHKILYIYKKKHSEKILRHDNSLGQSLNLNPMMMIDSPTKIFS